LLDAWTGIIERAPATLIFAGDGTERVSIAQRIDREGLSDSVRLLGTVGDIPELLRAADLFVLPSIAEGMSNSLLEAMATALPCVASDIGGNRDLIGDNRFGVLVAPNTPEAWTEALVPLLCDPQRRHSLGSLARGRVLAQYALPVVVERYVALYRRLIAGIVT
jgi:glycosyltransferase involved in cell wall biosynthesis